MDEKNWNIWIICNILGAVALLLYTILVAVGSTSILLAIRLLFACIATIAFSVRLEIEISSEENCVHSIILFLCCLFDVIFTAFQFG